MLLGRNSELTYLNNYYDKPGSQMVVVYGAKHIGKTSLVRKFIEDKPNYYYLARSASEREQQYLWAGQLSNDGKMVDAFPSFYELFQISCSDTVGKCVIVIDEFQNIVKASDDFMQDLVRFVHEKWDSDEVMIVLCSSTIGWIENSMITKIGSAAYELSGLLKLREMPFDDFVSFFPGFKMEECVEMYAILGGIPGLWKHFDDKLSVAQNVIKNILNPNAFLYEEGERMVSEQLRETAVYNTILASIAQGNEKLNDLFIHTDFSRAKISVYLKNLMELELVEKVFSYDTDGKDNAQKGIYRIINPFVNFYYTYVYPNQSYLENMAPAEFYRKFISPSFKKYTAFYFKQVCMQQLSSLNEKGRLPIHYEDSGRWVGKSGNIDVIAQDESGKTLIALCNWEKPMMTYEEYDWLLKTAKKAKIYPDYIYLYSASRFDEKLDLEAKVKENLTLIYISDFKKFG